ncbi:EAL domain-containing protein [Cytobacillus sp. S13-E01]|uniref:EAL domain-containing protein n=1 Tax=Cytobacillus sp. S13-E01 TaxID=3031326 RepID=UPI0023D7B997|nr:EAL domain-containing protein [Cytobacillus sp. S13-E01]MDF0725902.1 EAL domain-containing protein [Cytobacillus sp. S13-E01]
MENTAECVECIKRLRETGVSVSIDDFGTGYSSLTYLRNFPINHLKIDQSFIKEMIRNSQDIAIVKAIIYLAHELKVKVVAEGVEEKESLECLRLLGCDEIQGYYVGRPVPSSEFKMLLSNQSNDKGEIS